MSSNNNAQVNSSDPSVARQIQRESDSLLRGPTLSSAPSVSGPTNTASFATGSRIVRTLAPISNGSEVLFPQSTTTVSNDAVIINSSINNDTGDLTTVYSTNGEIIVNPINQTINQYVSADSGVNQIIAGRGITVTSTGISGTGIITINSNSASFGNIAYINLDGNVANVLHGDGSWSADQTTYSNSNVVSLMSAFGSNTITTTGNVSVGNIIGNGQALIGITGANVLGFVPNANVANTALTVAAANVSGLGNIATINLDGNVSNLLTGAGTFVAIPTGGSNANANYANFAGTAFSVDGANVTGTVANANYAANAGNANIANSAVTANSANSVTLANVSGAGNIASINLDGNVSNILTGAGTFVAIPTVSANANYANFAGTAFSVDGANVSGNVANATFALNAGNANIANIAYSVDGANVSGNVANATFALNAGNANIANTAGTVTANAQPNITSIGTLTSLDIAGNVAAGNLTTTGVLSVTGTGVSSIAGNLDMTSNTIINLATPTNPNDAANKQYVDDVAQGLDIHESVQAATPDTLTIVTGGTITYNNGVSGVGANLTTTGSFDLIDGVNVQVAGTRILIKDEANAAHNGIYTWSNSTVITRATDYDTVPEVKAGDFVFCAGGTLYNNTGWVQITSPTGIGGPTDFINFTQFSGAGTYTAGTGLTLTGSVFSVNASQTQITSVGTLTGLGVNGNITAANITANTGVFTGNGSGLTNLAGANVSGEVANATYAANAGNANIANLIDVTQVSNNYSYHVVLTTGPGDKSIHIDGSDNLQYNPNSGLLTAVRMDADYFVGDLSFANGYKVSNVVGIGNIATINLDGNVSNILTGAGTFVAIPTVSANANYANFAGTAFAVDGANVSGTVANATFAANAANAGNANVANSATTANTANSVTLANVSGAGNIASINLDGNVSNILTGAGTFVAIPTGGANANYANFAGNVTIAAQPNITSVGTLTDLVVGNVGNTVTVGNGTINATGNITALNFIGNIVYANSIRLPAIGDNNAVLFNRNNEISASLGMTFDTSNSLVVVGNISGNTLTAQAGVFVVANGAGVVEAPFLSSSVDPGFAPIRVRSSTLVPNLYVARANVADTVTVTAGTGNNFLVFATAATGNVSQVTGTGITADLLNNSITANTFIGNLVGNFVVPGANGEILFNSSGRAEANNALSFNNTTKVLNVNGNITSSGNLSVTANVAAGNLTTTGTIIGLIGTSNQWAITQVGTLLDLNVNGWINTAASLAAQGDVYGVGQASTLSGGFLEARVETGFAPLRINSTTRVANLNVARAGVADSVTLANISGVGNIASINLDGNVSNLLTGAGTFVAIPTGGSNANANYANFAGTAFSVDGANVSGTVANATYAANAGNANIANLIDVTQVSNNYSYHVVLTTGPGDKSVHIDGSDNLQYNPNSGLLTAVRMDADYFVGDLSFANGYNVSNVVGIGNIATVNLDGNVSNLLTGAGTFVAIPTVSTTANYANFAGNVTIAAQPNITSVGTLANLSVTGNITTSANLVTNLIVGQSTGVSITATGTNQNIKLAPTGIGFVDVSGKIVGNLATPVASTDAATKQYVDDVAQGLHVHASCNAATTGNLATISGGTVIYNNGTAGVGASLVTTGEYANIDGVTLTNGMRILVKNEDDAAHNGIYDRTSTTVLTRATDFDTGAEIQGGDFVFVSSGDNYNSTGWVQIDEVTTVGTDPIEWVQFSGAGTYKAGTGLTLTGDTFSISNTTVTASSYGNGDSVATFTVNSQGQLTAASNVAITANAANLTGSTLASSITTSSLTSVGTLDNLAVTGNVTAGNANVTGQLISTIATGTAPLAVTSTTQVANLNAATAGLATFATTANAVAGANVSGTVANATFALDAGNANFANSATVANSANSVNIANVTGLVLNQSTIYVGLNGNDTTGNGTVINPYLTISKAVDSVGSGGVIIVYPGGYYEDVTINNKFAITISSETPGGRQPFTPAIYGNLTISGNSSSISFKGIGVEQRISHTSSGTVYLSEFNLGSGNVVGALSKTGSGSLSIQNCSMASVSGGDITPVTISGAGNVLFSNVALGLLSVSNTAASVSMLSDSTSLQANISAGSLNIFDSVLYTLANSESNAIVGTGGVINVRNSIAINPNQTTARLNIGPTTVLAYDDFYFDRPNSNVGINPNITIDFQSIRLANTLTANFVAGTLTTASQPNITSVGTLTSLGVTGNITAANITANTGVFTGNGSGLSAIAGANVTGTVANATFALNAGVANSANSVTLANVSGAGNIANINLTGSNTNVLYGNGVFAAVAGGANTGNVTFDNVTVQGVDGLNLSAGANFTANLAYLRVRPGHFPTEIHLDTGNNQAYNQYFGDNNKYVKLEQGDSGNVVIGTNTNSFFYNWTFDNEGNLTLPSTSLGVNLDEQTVIHSQRKIIPPDRWSAEISGSTPTVVYTASAFTQTLKSTFVVQHSIGGFEMFDVAAIRADGANTVYTVSNRLNTTGEDYTTVVVDLFEDTLTVTLTVNSGANTSWVTYDSTEFGIANAQY